MKYAVLIGTGLAAATVLVTPWSALAVTRPSHSSSATPHQAFARQTAAAARSAGQAPPKAQGTDPVESGCSFTASGAPVNLWTLDGNCTVTGPIVVPDGVTVAGADHIITVTGNAVQAPNGVLMNAGSSMSVESLTINGSALTGVPPSGIIMTNASGTLTNVHVDGMTVGNGVQEGFGIRVVTTSAANPHTVTITGSSITGFQKNGLVAAGPGTTVNVSESTIGPPAELFGSTPGAGIIAQNSVVYHDGAGGVFDNNVVTGFPSNRTDSPGTGVVLSHAADVTVSGSTIGGPGLDAGIVVQNSSGVSLEHNTIRLEPAPDGVANVDGTTGIFDDAASDVTLVGNTFQGDWETRVIHASQEPYIVTKDLPPGTVSRTYFARLAAIAESPAEDLRWAVVGGALPPGLHIVLGSDPHVAGTPTRDGTFHVRLRVTDLADDGIPAADRDFTIVIHPADVFLHVTKTAFPDPAAAGQPVTFTVTTFNGGPDTALGVTVKDHLPTALTGFTWTCEASAPPSRCSAASGSGPVSAAPVDIAARGTVIFRIRGTVPTGLTSIMNTATVTPGPGTDNLAPAADGTAAVTVPVGPALPLTGPDLMPEAAGGVGFLALGGLLLLPTLRRRRRPGTQA